jgi:tyrosyl-DNA phosphodiesterase-1
MSGYHRKHFDADVRDRIKVKIVHGFWRRDDERKSRLFVSPLF